MHHRATIDLAQLSAYATPRGLPKTGKLVFFAHARDAPYEGKVIHVPDGLPPTLPPENLPHIFYEGQFSFGRNEYTEADAPTEHLHWAVDFMELPMDTGRYDDLAGQAMAARFPDASGMQLSVSAFAETCPEMTRPILWETAQRYVRKTVLAETHLAKTMELAQWNIDKAKDGAVEKQAYLQQNTHALRKFIDEISAWAKPHDRWDPMTDDDRGKLDAFRARVTPGKAALGLWLYYPHAAVLENIADIRGACDATFRTIARGPEPQFRLLPKRVQEQLDQTHRLPGPHEWHQMFGLGVNLQVAGEEHQYDHLLLQLHTDHMMNGVWAQPPVVQYWISPAHLKQQAWDKVVVTMESD